MKRSEIKILLVEDDQNLGKALYEGLKRLNYSVRWTTSPEEGLNQFRISEPDLVILDSLIPKKNGVELALEMRNYTGSGFKPHPKNKQATVHTKRNHPKQLYKDKEKSPQTHNLRCGPVTDLNLRKNRREHPTRREKQKPEEDPRAP